MKKNINEQVSRIKQMMGLNEDRINLDDYKDDSSIIEDIKRVGTTDDGYPIISMKLNTFIPNADSLREGNSVKIEIILEWEVALNKETRDSHGFRLRKVSSIITDVGLGEIFIKYLREKFANQPTPKKLVQNIYGPYLINSTSKGSEYFHKVFDNAYKDTDILMNVLLGDETEKIDPNIENEPSQEKPSKGSGRWTSTSSL